MAPEVAVNNIPNLTISVNKSGVSDKVTLLVAYKDLDRHQNDINTKRPDIGLADGHGSRLYEKVLSFLEQSQTWLFILRPYTSGGTQMHIQINNGLHDEYEKSKSELYSEMSNLSRESFMTILDDVWNKWATPDFIVKSGKHVGISINGLNIKWMQQNKFRHAEALLEPVVSSPPSSSGSSVLLSSPVGVRIKTSAYYLDKLNKSLELIEELQSTSVTPDEI